METRLYRVALVIWNTGLAVAALANQYYEWPSVETLAFAGAVGNLIIVALRQLLDPSTPTLPSDGS